MPSIGPAQRIDHATQQLRSDRHFQDAARGLDGVAFLDGLVVAQHHGADRVLFEVERQAEQLAAGNSIISP